MKCEQTSFRSLFRDTNGSIEFVWGSLEVIPKISVDEVVYRRKARSTLVLIKQISQLGIAGYVVFRKLYKLRANVRSSLS